MTGLPRALALGAAAGAAGTTALNAVTYLDMAVRGRPASSTPEQTVEKIAELTGLPVPGEGETRQNRLSGLGALTGAVTGVGVGALAGAVLHRRDLGTPVLAVVISAGAMVAANGPMTALRITDPRSWGASGWASDIVPHVAYGTVTAAVARALLRR